MGTRAVLCVAAAFCFLAAPGRAGKLEDLLAKMEAAERDVKTLTFSFTQEAHLAATGETQKIRGTVAFRRPGHFRVEHTSPRGQTVVSDGVHLWFYNPERRQLYIDKWDNWTRSGAFPQGLAPFQMNVGDLKAKYRMGLGKKSGRGDPPGAQLLALTPLDAGPWPFALRMWVQEKTGIPVQTELESQSVKTLLTIQKMEVNPPLDDKLFVFEAPPGAEVFSATEALP